MVSIQLCGKAIEEAKQAALAQAQAEAEAEKAKKGGKDPESWFVLLRGWNNEK